MKYKKNLKEQYDTSKGKFPNNPILEIADRAGCFTPKTDNSKQVTSPPNNAPKGKEVESITDPVTKRTVAYRMATNSKYANTPHVLFFDDRVVQLRKEFDKFNESTDKKIIWICNELESRTNPSTAGLSQDLIDVLKNNNIKLFNEVTAVELPNYQKIDLSRAEDINKLPDSVRSTIQTYSETFKDKPFFVLMPKGLTAKASNPIEDARKCLDTYLNAGAGWKDFTVETPSQNQNIEKVFLKDVCKSGGFTNDYYVWRDLSDMDTNSLKISLKQWSNDTNSQSSRPKNWCKNGINLYYTAYTKKTIISQFDIDNYKPKIKNCVNKYEGNWGLFGNQIEKKIRELNIVSREIIVGKEKLNYNIAETISSSLKKTIRENISKINESKNASLLQEGKIINNRFNIITEGTTLKNKKDQKKVGKELFNEMIYLNKQGYSQELISEGLFDIFLGIFPKGVSEPIMQYFKEEAAKWLAGKFGLDPNSWLSSIIISAIGNLNIGDVSKLTDCNFVTKLLSKSIAEGALRKIQTEKFGDNALYNLIRNTLVDSLESTDLGTKLEDKLGSLICPMVSSLSGKMEGAADMMKQKALGAV